MSEEGKEELEDRHRVLMKELEQTHELKKMGLEVGKFLGLIVVLLLFLASIGGDVSLIAVGKAYINGAEMVTIVAIVVAGFLIYFAFVFGRVASIKSKISKTEKQIVIEAGDKAK